MFHVHVGKKNPQKNNNKRTKKASYGLLQGSVRPTRAQIDRHTCCWAWVGCGLNLLQRSAEREASPGPRSCPLHSQTHGPLWASLLHCTSRMEEVFCSSSCMHAPRAWVGPCGAFYNCSHLYLLLPAGWTAGTMAQNQETISCCEVEDMFGDRGAVLQEARTDDPLAGSGFSNQSFSGRTVSLF